MTNKEALERIKTLHVVAMSMLYDRRTDEEIKNAVKVIEQALKRLDDLEEAIVVYASKSIDIGMLMISDDYLTYNSLIAYSDYFDALTKKEFDLLKGVSEND